MGTSDTDRLIGIDCLRAVAILWVMLYHFGPVPLIGNGTNGVLLFFIISGYCISFSADSSRSAWHFYAKRFGRLFPALVVCGFITTVFKHLLLQNSNFLPVDSWRDYFVTLYAIPTLNVFRVDYIPPDRAYWSLSVEFQFYFLCCFAMTAGLKEHLLKVVCVVAAFWTLNSPTNQINSSAFFPFFIAGLSIASIAQGKTFEGITGLLVAACIDIYQLKLHFNQLGARIELSRSETLWISTAMVYFASRYEIKSAVVRRFLLPIAFVGLISYPLYLIHQDVGRIILMMLGIPGDSSISTIAIRAIAVPVLVGCVAWIVYFFVERPLIKPLVDVLSRPFNTFRDANQAAAAIFRPTNSVVTTNEPKAGTSYP